MKLKINDRIHSRFFQSADPRNVASPVGRETSADGRP